MLRKLLAIVGGFIAGFLVIAIVEFVSNLIYPPPANLDLTDEAALQEFITNLPIGAFAMVLFAHASGSFAAGAVCAIIARRKWYIAALGLGVLFLLAGIAMLAMIPHPLWFAIIDVLLYIPLALAGCRIGGAFVRQPIC